jgi:hypothetical protein
MKIITTIAFGFVVLIAAVFFLGCSMCAINPPYLQRGELGVFIVYAAISFCVMLGGIVVIAKTNREE